MSVCILAGNLSMLIAILSRPGKISRMNYFLVHLSLADILTALLTLVPEIAWTITSPEFLGGNALCKVVKFLQMLGPYLSSFLLCVTSLDRHRAICQPFKQKKSKRFILIAWILALLCSLPQSFIFQIRTSEISVRGKSEVPEEDYEVSLDNLDNEDMSNMTLQMFLARIHPGLVVQQIENCEENFPSWLNIHHYVLYYSFVNFFIPLIILVLANSLICRTIWTSGSVTASRMLAGNSEVRTRGTRGRGRRRVTELSVSSCRSSSVVVSKAKVRSVKLTLVIIICYILSSSPFIVGQLLFQFSEDKKFKQKLGEKLGALFWLMPLNSLVNPMVYLTFNRNILCSRRRNSQATSTPS